MKILSILTTKISNIIIHGAQHLYSFDICNINFCPSNEFRSVRPLHLAFPYLADRHFCFDLFCSTRNFLLGFLRFISIIEIFRSKFQLPEVKDKFITLAYDKKVKDPFPNNFASSQVKPHILF